MRREKGETAKSIDCADTQQIKKGPKAIKASAKGRKKRTKTALIAKKGANLFCTPPMRKRSKDIPRINPFIFFF